MNRQKGNNQREMITTTKNYINLNYYNKNNLINNLNYENYKQDSKNENFLNQKKNMGDQKKKEHY